MLAPAGGHWRLLGTETRPETRREVLPENLPETRPEQTNSTNGKKLTTGASNDRPQKRVKEGEEVACEESHYIRQGQPLSSHSGTSSNPGTSLLHSPCPEGAGGSLQLRKWGVGIVDSNCQPPPGGGGWDDHSLTHTA